MALSKNELIRYSRQLVIPELRPAGQEKLKAAKVTAIGSGGLGSLVLGYLAGAGSAAADRPTAASVLTLAG